jgi:hypothetical protein
MRRPRPPARHASARAVMSPDRKSSKRLLAKPRRTPARAARPRKRRHWPLTEIGSELWWRQARKLGVERQRVEATLDIAHSEGRETIDPHHLLPGESTAEQAVTYILVFKYVPTYASLMYVSHCWSKAGRSLKEWWVPSSELLHEGRPIGRLRHYGFPFDREIPHKVYGTLEEETPGKAVLFRVEGSATSARSAIGSDIEAWPPGLGPGRRGHAAGLRGDGSRIPPVDPTR